MTTVPVEAVVVIPAIAIPVLALISGYRLGAALNVVACALTSLQLSRCCSASIHAATSSSSTISIFF